MINKERRISLVNTRNLVLTMLLLILVLPMIGGCSCSKQKMEVEELVDSLLPTMHTFDVHTLISDSGITKYKVKSPDWAVYEKVKRPFWHFPQGVNFEKLDTLYQTEASVECDSALYYSKEELWHLMRNVRIRNVKNESFTTDEMFWDSRAHRIYSDKFIHIEKEDIIIEGVGFESNETLTKYTIRETQGVFPMVDKAPQDSLKTDTVE